MLVQRAQLLFQYQWPGWGTGWGGPLTEQSWRPQGRQLWEAGPNVHGASGRSSVFLPVRAVPWLLPVCPGFSRLSTAQRTPCRDCRPLLEGEEGGSRGIGGPAKSLMEHSWASPPGRRRREAARARRRLPRRWPLGCTAARSRPGPAPRRALPASQPGEPAGERGKAGPCVPRAVLEGAPAAGS